MNFTKAMKQLSPRVRLRFCKLGAKIIRNQDVRASVPGLFMETGDSIVAAHVPHDGRHLLGERL